MATPPRQQRVQGPQVLPLKWLTLLALPILLVSTWYGFYSAWGIMFVFWGITSTLSGQVYLVEPIERTRNPVLFWIISVMWIGFGVLYVIADFYPQIMMA